MVRTVRDVPAWTGYRNGMTAQGAAAGDAAREARDHPAVDRAARVGMAAYGVLYLLIGWLAAQLALGQSKGSASGGGALEEIAQKPWGVVALWVVGAGLLAFGVWQCFQAVGGHRDEDGRKRVLARVASATRAVVMVTLAVLAVRTALGSGSGGSGGSGGATGKVMSLPFGPVLVMVVAVVILVIAVASAHRGLTDRWRKDLELDGRTGHTGRLAAVLARAGYVSRAVAFAVIAFLFARAAIEHDSSESGGLDQAIVRFRDEPFGPWLIVVVAIGLSCFGAYHLVRAWYLRTT